MSINPKIMFAAKGRVGQAPLLIASGVLAAPAASLTVANIPARNRYLVIIDGAGFALVDQLRMRFNGDAGNNYAYRLSTNGAADTIGGPASSITIETLNRATPRFAIIWIQNIQTWIKFCRIVSMYSAGGPSIPDRSEGAGVWNNVVNQINSITIYGSGGNNLLAGTSLRVYSVD